jgi:hypothetical protein
MKNNSIVLAGAVALSAVTMASATTTNFVYISGSTAARNSVVQAIEDQFTSHTTVAQGNSTYYKASYQVITGTLSGDSSGAVTVVKTHWSGSEGGIADLVGSPANEAFLDTAATNNTSSVTQLTDNHAVDLAMADNDVSYSQHPTAPITGTFCGIIPFYFVKEKGSAAGINNVTDAQMLDLLSGGTRTALLTGNSGDVTWTYITGRDSFSGTRVNTLGDTGYGIYAFPYQVKIASDGSMIDVDGSGNYVGYDYPDLSLYGYASGGSIATQMGYDLGQATSVDAFQGTANHFSIITYLGASDAGTAVANGGTLLTYNGVTESTAAIQQGVYSFWGNEFVFKKNSGESSTALALYGLLINPATGINHRADGSTFIDLTTMGCSRNGPTSPPVHNR